MTCNKKDSGFTLIELMVVISIIGMLASFVLSSLNITRAKSRDIKRLVEIRDIINALESYRNEYGHYYCTNLQKSNSPNFLRKMVEEGFLTNAPRDPINIYPKVYRYVSFKSTPGGPCGQIVEFSYDFEFGASSCGLNGKNVLSPTHCHVYWPTPLPCLGNEYSEDPSNPCVVSLRDDCWSDDAYVC